MVSQSEYNQLVKRYNFLLQQIAEGKTAPSKEKQVETITSGEVISLGDINLQSNVLPVNQLYKLLVQMLEDKTIKNYLSLREKKKKREVMSGIG